MTGILGATSENDCRVPILHLRPTLPTRCTPPSCQDGPTPVDVYWAMESIDAPEDEDKTASSQSA